MDEKLIDESNDLKIIEEVDVIVSKNLDRDEILLLKEALCCYKKKLFFASSSLLWIFIEKYFREILIYKELNKGKDSYDKIEMKYED